MTFKEFLQRHHFILIKASFTQREYTNGKYSITVNNKTNIASLYHTGSNNVLADLLNSVSDYFDSWEYFTVY